jgi:putative PIG3 family NAD(P)H quinone oxidoreductase
VITEPGGPEVLQLQEVPDPVAGPGHVLIDVAATAVNRADLMQRAGNYPPPPGASHYPGLECSGTITALGEGVQGLRVGDEVCALLAGGGYAEKVAVPAGQVMRVPATISVHDSAALPETACTVWSMVFDIGRLQPGERLLVHGGTSGIGTMAIQLAHKFGARVLTTVGSARKAEVAASLGADVVINYREQDFADIVSADGGADVILDSVGAKYLEPNVRALAPDGRVVVLGFLGGRTGSLDLGVLMAKRGTITSAGLRARSLDQKAAIVTSTEAFVWPLIADGEIAPVIDRSFDLADAGAAHELLESSEHIGKVLLTVR